MLNPSPNSKRLINYNDDMHFWRSIPIHTYSADQHTRARTPSRALHGSVSSSSRVCVYTPLIGTVHMSIYTACTFDISPFQALFAIHLKDHTHNINL